jgi:hypothetical protein
MPKDKGMDTKNTAMPAGKSYLKLANSIDGGFGFMAVGDALIVSRF